MQANSRENIVQLWPSGAQMPSEELLSALGRMMDAYMERMQVCNFTAHRTPERFALLNVIDSVIPYLAGDLHIADGAQVADIGTGGGFPGVPLAVLAPKAQFRLFDSVGKKLKVIDEVTQALPLMNIATQHVRLEEFGRESGREAFDVVTSRAVAHWTTLLELALPMLRVGGVLYAYQGERIFEELEEKRSVIELLGGKLLPSTSYDLGEYGKRYIIPIKKVASSPADYPRDYALMVKKPL